MQEDPNNEGLVKYLVEAANVDMPYQRAYIKLSTMEGMRGNILKYYVDQMLKIYADGEEVSIEDINKDKSTGYGDHVIGFIEFVVLPSLFKSRMAKDPVYHNWKYEEEYVEEKKKI